MHSYSLVGAVAVAVAVIIVFFLSQRDTAIATAAAAVHCIYADAVIKRNYHSCQCIIERVDYKYDTEMLYNCNAHANKKKKYEEKKMYEVVDMKMPSRLCCRCQK